MDAARRTALLLLTFLVTAWLRWGVWSAETLSKDRPARHDAAAALLAARSAASAAAAFRGLASASIDDSVVALLAARSTAAAALDAGVLPPDAMAIAATLGACSTCRGVVLDTGGHGQIRLHLRPEWCNASEGYVLSVASAASAASDVYRLEPGFLIQGRLVAPGVPKLASTARAGKVMERGEVGWAGGGAGPDFFIYLGDGPATWLGAPHDGTIFAEVADEVRALRGASLGVV
jgi:hypothetical protein